MLVKMHPAAGLALMVVGMLGLGYVASHSKSEFSIATGAQQIVTVSASYTSIDPKDRELEALQAEAEQEEAQSLRSGPRSDENAPEGKADGIEQTPGSNVLQQEEGLLDATSNTAGGVSLLYL